MPWRCHQRGSRRILVSEYLPIIVLTHFPVPNTFLGSMGMSAGNLG